MKVISWIRWMVTASIVPPMVYLPTPSLATKPLANDLPTSISNLTLNSVAQVKSVTVSISVPGSNGSGVIVHRQGNKYLVLTAAHVVRTRQNYTIRTADGQQHQLQAADIRTFPNNIDLAIVSFNSSKNYPVATIGNSDDAEEGSTADVAGYPRGLQQIAPYSFRKGKIVAHSQQSLSEGYDIIYSSGTLPGMSGGGVFNERGQLIAIHGRGDVVASSSAGNTNIRIKTGYDLGIPINTFVRQAKDLKGLPTFKQVVAQNRNRPRAGNIFLQGIHAFRDKKFSEAIGFFDRAIAINPKDAVAYYYRGASYYGLKNTQAAFADLEKSIQLDGRDPAPYLMRALIYSSQSNYQKMGADANRAIQLDPNNSMAYTIKAFSYVEKGATSMTPAQRQKALVDLNKAISLDSTNGLAYLMRGFMLYPDVKDRKKLLVELRLAMDAYKAAGDIAEYNSTKSLVELLQTYPAQ
jgi:S1-C subfamily serine protease